jgi:hypothetical protein
MDECRFDNWTRMLGAIQDRRTALKDVVAAGAALVSLARLDLGLAQEDEVTIEGCRLTGNRCDRNKQCCSNKCNRKRRKRRKHKDGDHKRRRRRSTGTCGCLGNGKKCRKDAACCKGRCDVNDRRCRCVPANDLCNKDSDCCGRRNCRQGVCKT